MKKALICLLCAVLLCGLFACGTDQEPTAPEEKNEPIAAQPTAEQPTAEPAATDAPAFSESDARPLTFAEDADTRWIARGKTLLLYPEGTGILKLHKNNYQQHLNITERDGTFLAEIQMYRTPFDSEPAYCFPAGELRLFTDGNAVRIKVTEDPLGIFADEEADGAILAKSDYKPYRFIFANSGNTPDQPNTEWGVHFKNGRQTFLVDENRVGVFVDKCAFTDSSHHNRQVVPSEHLIEIGFEVIDSDKYPFVVIIIELDFPLHVRKADGIRLFAEEDELIGSRSVECG